MTATQMFIDFWCSDATSIEFPFESEKKRNSAEHMFWEAKQTYGVDCDVQRMPNFHLRLTRGANPKDIRKVCGKCGAKFKPCGNRKFCVDCTGSIVGGKLQRPANNEKPKPKTLAELQREARERGMSYGQYVALLERGVRVG